MVNVTRALLPAKGTGIGTSLELRIREIWELKASRNSTFFAGKSARATFLFVRIENVRHVILRYIYARLARWI
jgi:hypothetical protein